MRSPAAAASFAIETRRYIPVPQFEQMPLRFPEADVMGR
jgi:hypothetical protein